MILITLDEGYVFDLLSILHVKKTKADESNRQHIESSFEKMKNEIANQIGLEKLDEIISSKEYDELFNANRETFELVDLVKSDNGLAKQVDDSNYKRYLCKKKLQKNFFESNITEVKIGYK